MESCNERGAAGTVHPEVRENGPVSHAVTAPAGPAGAAHPPALVPRWAGQFDSFGQWVAMASSWLTARTDFTAVCVDAKGRRCTIGLHMARARDENAFPVRFFWECEPIPMVKLDSEAAVIDRMRDQLRVLRDAASGTLRESYDAACERLAELAGMAEQHGRTALPGQHAGQQCQGADPFAGSRLRPDAPGAPEAEDDVSVFAYAASLVEGDLKEAADILNGEQPKPYT